MLIDDFIIIATFLIAYFILIICGAIPIIFLEITLGQYTSTGVLTCWSMAPFFKGKIIEITVLITLLNALTAVKSFDTAAWQKFCMAMCQ